MVLSFLRVIFSSAIFNLELHFYWQWLKSWNILLTSTREAYRLVEHFCGKHRRSERIKRSGTESMLLINNTGNFVKWKKYITWIVYKFYKEFITVFDYCLWDYYFNFFQLFFYFFYYLFLPFLFNFTFYLLILVWDVLPCKVRICRVSIFYSVFFRNYFKKLSLSYSVPRENLINLINVTFSYYCRL